MPTVDLSACHKLGFKSVQARKWWHGRFGFLSHDPQGRPDRRAGPLGSSCLSPIELPQSTPDPTKFLAASIECDYANAYYYRGLITPDQPNATVTTAAAVGRYTGVITQTNYSATGSDAPSIALAQSWLS